MTPSSVPFLKALVIVLGVLLIAGFALVVITITVRISSRGVEARIESFPPAVKSAVFADIPARQPAPPDPPGPRWARKNA